MAALDVVMKFLTSESMDSESTPTAHRPVGRQPDWRAQEIDGAAIRFGSNPQYPKPAPPRHKSS